MLFDLRGAGRRNTVRVIYLMLAVLMGGGLVFFGVGGSVGGGLLNAVNSNGSGGGGDALAKQARQLEARVRRNPANEHLWAQLAQTQFEDASSGSNYDQNTGFTASGKVKLKAATSAWARYVSSNPAKPDYAIAAQMVQAYGTLGRGGLGVAAQEIVTDAQPSSGSYEQLAQYAYAAGQTRKGDLAAAKAIALAPKDQRNTVKSNIDEFKSELAQQQTQSASGTGTTG